MNPVLQDFSPEAIARVIEENAVEEVKSWQAWPGMELHEGPDLLWTITDVPFPIFNNVLRTHLAPDQVDAAVDAALARAEARNVPMAWWLGPTATPAGLGNHLEARGFIHADDLTGMAADLLSVDVDLPAPPRLVIEEVVDQDSLAAWCQISSRVFDVPSVARQAWSQAFASVPFGPGEASRRYLALLDGLPVGTSSLFLAAGVAGISSVSTIPEARRQGIGSAVTLEPLKEARRLGYRVATLFSSAMAVSMYQKLGFQEYCRGGLYLWMDQ